MRRLSVFLGIALFISSSFAAAQDFRSLRLPVPGEKAPFAWELEDTSAIGGRGLSGAVMARAVRRLADGDELQTRGAREANLFRTLSPSVVLIVTDESFGSGSIIFPELHIVTNWHVVAGYDEVAIIFKPASRQMEITPTDVAVARVLYVDQISDLALLELMRPLPDGIAPIELGSTTEVNVGDDVHAIGHPTGEFWTYTKGYVSQIRPGYEWFTEGEVTHRAEVIQTQTPISPGSSGGPLISDDGKMIGINSFVSLTGENRNFAVSVDEVKLFLDRRSNRLAEARPPDPETCSVEVVFEGRNERDDAYVRTYDRDCDGVVDSALIIPDDLAEPFLFVYDDEQIGQANGYVLDNDRDGSWDISYWDTTGDGESDMIGHHPDGKITPSNFEPS